jgi:TonB-linked SusC/RagA family outer membrane protein
MRIFYKQFRLLKLFFLLLTLFLFGITHAQDRTITGKVTSSENGEPIPGVSIIISGTNTGTITDLNGNYSFSVSSGASLTFSSVGFMPQTIQVASQTVINVVLEPDIQQLSEVVVIGYGTKSRKLMTESIGKVESEEILKIPVASADAAIQGRLSGVQVTSVDGTPGSPVAIRVRGVGTVGNTQPLYVIDGIPVGRNSGNIINPLSTINPNDIESISVLKDASASAVYGVRAANGVVLITTKRGQQGKPTISYDGYYGIQKIPDLWSVMDVDQWTEITQEAYDNYNDQNALTPADPSYRFLHPDVAPGGDYTAEGLASRGLDQDDWTGDLVNENAPITNHNLAVSGGSETANYAVSLGYFKQEAVVKKWDLERLSFRANGDYKIGSRFKFGQTLAVSYQEVIRGVNGGGDGFLLNNGATMPPFFQIYDELNRIPGNRYGFDGNLDVAGLVIGNQNGINQIRTNWNRNFRMLGGIYGELEIVKGLFFKTAANIDYNNSRNDSWNPGYTDEETGLDRPNQERNDGRGENSTKVFTNTLNYVNSFGSHNLNAIIGIEYQDISGRSLSARGENFLSSDPNFWILVKNSQTGQQIGGGAFDQTYLSYFGRISYDFKNKYLITGTIRRDGTSSFSAEDNRRWGTFPSISGAWRVNEETFWSSSLITELKIRASWGQLGNDETTAFPHIFRVSPTPDYGLSGSVTVQAPAPINFVNQDVIWETVETFDVGFDMGFLNDKITLLFTYYDKKTRDFLINLPIPLITGYASTSKNVGLVTNKGIELELGYKDNFTNGYFDVSANLTTVTNEVVELAEGVNEFLETGGYRTGVGYPIGYMYGYETAGIYQTPGEAAEALPDASSPQGPRAGDVIFVDNNGPAPEDAPAGQQFSGEPDGQVDFNDRTYLGKTIPDLYYGLNFAVGWKGLDLTLFFQGVSGVQLYNAFRQRAENAGLAGGGRNGLTTVMDRWTGEGSSNTIPRAINTDPNDNGRFSDRFVEDAGYFRLKNLQIGYTFPQSLLDKTKSIQNLRIYLGATNLLTFTNYSGLDPEVMTYRSSGSQIGQDVAVGNPPQGGSGTDNGSIPIPRTIQLGLGITF